MLATYFSAKILSILTIFKGSRKKHCILKGSAIKRGGVGEALAIKNKKFVAASITREGRGVKTVTVSVTLQLTFCVYMIIFSILFVIFLS